MKSPLQSPSATPAVKEVSGPKGRPMMGVLPEIRRDRLGFIGRLIREYKYVVKLPVFNLTTYFICHPEGVQRVLQDNHRNYMKGQMPMILHGRRLSP